jgi:hypothetical protein
MSSRALKLDNVKSQVLCDPLEYSLPLPTLREKGNTIEAQVSEGLQTGKEGKEMGCTGGQGHV